MKNAIKFTLVCLLSASSFPSIASSQKVNMAIDAAQALCSTPHQFGSGSSLKLSAQAKADVGKIIRKLASANGNVNAEYIENEWLGVRQEELAKAMKDSNSCKSNIFTLVMQDFGGQGWSKSFQTSKKIPYISHPNGTAPITPTPTYTDLQGACWAETGSDVQLLAQKKIDFGNFVKVRVLNGTCKGAVGWISKEFYRI
ncbi:hypothetical protein BZG20_05830 [Salinivibrio sp. IB868]|uniref:hypothetical protein n=1 Tax=unclassified Salinivibrio TaxID=2636825 RepID=UPI0009860D56|nr:MULTISPECIES: hypothetical protein [unclassified Salinivibrio]OOE67539.1 hypothetical protein BZG20_05830 [Salinivibrio sp. IB868]OOE71186.1 hypothetical protein BZG22_15425 [Salinivibrio sp. IB870]